MNETDRDCRGVRISHIEGGVTQEGSDPTDTGQKWKFGVLKNPGKLPQRPPEAINLEYIRTCITSSNNVCIDLEVLFSKFRMLEK